MCVTQIQPSQNMPSPTFTVRLNHDLFEIANILAKRYKYPDRNALIKGLLRYAAMVDGEHVITQPMSGLAADAQDRIDAKLLENLKRGKAERGQYLKHLLDGDSKPQEIGRRLAES